MIETTTNHLNTDRDADIFGIGLWKGVGFAGVVDGKFLRFFVQLFLFSYLVQIFSTHGNRIRKRRRHGQTCTDV